MKIECLNCQTAYSVASSKIPQKGVWVKCKKCGLKIHILPNEKKPDKKNAQDLKQQLDELNQSPHNRDAMLQIEDFEGEPEKPLPKQNLSEEIIKCPKCGKQQKKSIECIQCGAIFSKIKPVENEEIIQQHLNKNKQTLTKNLDKPLKNLTFSLIVSILSMVLFIISIEASNVLSFTFFIVMLLTSLLFYINLGILARRMGRSWIVWVGLTFITKPIGPIVSFFWIRSLVKKHYDNPILAGKHP